LPSQPRDNAAIPAKKPTPRELESFKQALLGLRGVLSGDIKNLHEDAFGINGEKATVDIEADAGSDSFYQEFSLELLQHDETALREIDEALVRFEGGNFGKCEGCQEWINKERLRAVPYTRFCIGCQRKAERES